MANQFLNVYSQSLLAMMRISLSLRTLPRNHLAWSYLKSSSSQILLSLRVLTSLILRFPVVCPILVLLEVAPLLQLPTILDVLWLTAPTLLLTLRALPSTYDRPMKVFACSLLSSRVVISAGVPTVLFTLPVEA